MKKNKFIIVKAVNIYGGLIGSVIRLRVKKDIWDDRLGWDWLNDYQRKRLEQCFGKENAYRCMVYDKRDWQYEIY